MKTDLTQTDYQDRMQNSLTQKPSTDPAGFFDLVNGLSRSAHILYAIEAAAKLNLFDLLKTPLTEEEITQSFSYPDMIQPLIQILTGSGLIEEREGKFCSSPLARDFFSVQSPYSQIPYLEKQLWHLTDLWENLPSILTQGPRLYDEEEFFALRSLPSMAANALTGRLQEVTDAVSHLPRFATCRRMIDLGGGHGLYAMALAKRNPDLTAIVYDHPQVTPLARDTISRYGMEKQVTTVGGDFFTDTIGSGYDIVLSSSNPSGKTRSMIPVIISSLNPGGYFVNIQPGDKKVDEDPCIQLEWELWNFAGSEIPKSSWGQKQGFFTDEYREALIDAGFDIISVSNISDLYIRGYSVTMVIAEKR
jgi:hypothetical protein